MKDELKSALDLLHACLDEDDYIVLAREDCHCLLVTIPLSEQGDQSTDLNLSLYSTTPGEPMALVNITCRLPLNCTRADLEELLELINRVNALNTLGAFHVTTDRQELNFHNAFFIDTDSEKFCPEVSETIGMISFQLLYLFRIFEAFLSQTQPLPACLTALDELFKAPTEEH